MRSISTDIRGYFTYVILLVEFEKGPENKNFKDGVGDSKQVLTSLAERSLMAAAVAATEMQVNVINITFRLMSSFHPGNGDFCSDTKTCLCGNWCDNLLHFVARH